ncbi:MAG TPA: aldehyde dehydrogenase family protein, partial [Bryobacteraceae bacterium]
MMKNSQNWIGGEWMTPGNGETVIHSPSNVLEQVGVLHLSDASHVVQAGQAAQAAFPAWARLTGAGRADYLYRMAEALKARLTDVATLASTEMGKPITEMRGEVMRAVNLLNYYAAEGVRPNGSVIPSSETQVVQYTKRVPLGVVGIVTPWNFPVAIPLWKIAPALICGNTIVWKPAEFASLTATLIVEIFASIGLPAGVLNLIIGSGRQLGGVLLEQAGINAFSFTGSTSTGLQVAETCARNNIKYQTEMGGKNAAIVLNDADLEKTIPMILSGAFRSAGQKCTATSRVIVEKGIYEPFIRALQKGVASIRQSTALDPAAYLGPVASYSQYKTVMSYAKLARE